MPVRAEPAKIDDRDALELRNLGPFATIARDDSGVEYLSLSDGGRRIRLDIREGSLLQSPKVRIHYLLSGFAALETQFLTIRRLVALRNTCAFAGSLFSPSSGSIQRIEALRTADALAEGASYREIAIALFGYERVRDEWRDRSDYLLSRVRRRVAEAKHMAGGGYRNLIGLRSRLFERGSD